VATEQLHARSARLDELSTLDAVRLFAEDHAIVARAAADAAPALAAFIDDLALRVSEGGRLFYVGAGTSGRLGVLDASECPPTFQSSPDQVIGIIAGGDAALRTSSEGAEDDRNGAHEELRRRALGAADTLVGIAAGGTTPYVLGAFPLARSLGALTALITSSPPAPGSCDAEHLILLATGSEVLTGSTRLKAASAAKLALNVISTLLFVRLGKVYGQHMVDLRASNAKLMDRATRTIRHFLPGMDAPSALTLLHAAGGQVKIAIVMARRGVDRAQAAALLAASGGMLRKVIDEITTSPSR